MSGVPGDDEDYRLSFRIVSGCLEARVQGRIGSVEAIAGLFGRIGAELRRCGADQALILDETASVVPDAAEFEQMAALLAEGGFLGVRTAFVNVRGDAFERIEIGEIIARRHGHALRVFDSEPQARLWLRYVAD